MPFTLRDAAIDKMRRCDYRESGKIVQTDAQIIYKSRQLLRESHNNAPLIR